MLGLILILQGMLVTFEMTEVCIKDSRAKGTLEMEEVALFTRHSLLVADCLLEIYLLLSEKLLVTRCITY